MIVTMKSVRSWLAGSDKNYKTRMTSSQIVSSILLLRFEVMSCAEIRLKKYHLLDSDIRTYHVIILSQSIPTMGDPLDPRGSPWIKRLVVEHGGLLHDANHRTMLKPASAQASQASLPSF